jgi:hypothetical protein
MRLDEAPIVEHEHLSYNYPSLNVITKECVQRNLHEVDCAIVSSFRLQTVTLLCACTYEGKSGVFVIRMLARVLPCLG